MTNDFDKEFINTLNDLRVSTPNKIYIDMRLLKDYFLSAILSKVTNAKEYQYIISRIPQYNKRLIDDVEMIFPILNVKQGEIDDILSDTNKNVAIYERAPSTTYSIAFNHYLLSINNRCAVNNKDIIPELIINTYPIQLPKDVSDSIGQWFVNTYGYKVLIICKHMNDIDVELIKSTDDIFLYDLHSFVEHPVFSELLSDEKQETFRDTNVMSARLLKDRHAYEFHNHNEEAIVKDFIVSESYLNFMCNFRFLTDVKINVPS